MFASETVSAEAVDDAQRKLAEEGLRGLQHLIARDGKVLALRVELEGRQFEVPVPPILQPILVAVLRQIAKGHGVTTIGTESELTTQEAAGLLGVSRPHLVNLVDGGAIPFRKVGKHRRLRLDDVLSYQQNVNAPRAGTGV